MRWNVSIAVDPLIRYARQGEVDLTNGHGSIGQEVIDLSGQEPSMATLLRVTGYVLIVNMIESIAEGYVLAEKTGLGTANLQKLVAALFPGIYMTYSERMRSGSYLQAEVRVF